MSDKTFWLMLFLCILFFWGFMGSFTLNMLWVSRHKKDHKPSQLRNAYMWCIFLWPAVAIVLREYINEGIEYMESED